MPWKSAVGLTLALVLASLALVLALASVQQKRNDFRSADYSLLNADEINHRTLEAAAAIKVSRR
jgi:hypothetical protein